MVESGEVNLENFEAKKTKLSEIYNAGLESQRVQVSELIGKKIEKTVPKDFDERLKEISPTDPDALDKIKALGNLI
jgi:hypothetical protein